SGESVARTGGGGGGRGSEVSRRRAGRRDSAGHNGTAAGEAGACGALKLETRNSKNEKWTKSFASLPGTAGELRAGVALLQHRHRIADTDRAGCGGEDVPAEEDFAATAAK